MDYELDFQGEDEMEGDIEEKIDKFDEDAKINEKNQLIEKIKEIK